MVYFLIFLGGVLVGSIIANILRFEFTSFGILVVDTKNCMCKVLLSAEEIVQSKKKKVVLKINRDIDISRE